MILLGVIEFAFVFNAVLSVNFASRNAALLAAEAGPTAGADCVILRSIEQDVAAPADRNRIVRVEIYQAQNDGSPIGTTTLYRRDTSALVTPLSCMVDGVAFTMPYEREQDGYPESTRCNVLAGCGAGHPSIDYIAVQVTYTHYAVTPLRGIGFAGQLTFDRSNAMRIEPVL